MGLVDVLIRCPNTDHTRPGTEELAVRAPTRDTQSLVRVFHVVFVTLPVSNSCQRSLRRRWHGPTWGLQAGDVATRSGDGEDGTMACSAKVIYLNEAGRLLSISQKMLIREYS